MVFLELDRRGHYERSLCREDIDRTTAACRCGMTWGKENNAWIASFLNNSFKHSTSVCDTKNLALFSLFTSYLLTYHTVCLRGECLSVSFHLLPLSMPSLTHSITVYLQAVCTSGALKLPSHLGTAVHEYSSHWYLLLLLFTHNLKVNTEKMTPNVRITLFISALF